MTVYRAALWPLLSRMEPEGAHGFVLGVLGLGERVPGVLGLIERVLAVRDGRLERVVFGVRFPNPVGLAAGLDKEGRAPRAFASLGFGAVEVGTVTPRAQVGTPRPRVVRIPEARALINRMGFPNGGATAARARLLRAQRLPGGAVLGVNLGKNATTPLEEAGRDYVSVLDTLHDVADYAVVNVSSPNTKGLRDLQERRALEGLLKMAVTRRDELSRRSRRVPLLVKIAPDLDDSQLEAVVEVSNSVGIDGIVATNTTLSRGGVSGAVAQQTGGLSGEPLRRRATEIIRWLARETGGRLPIVGAGGISHPDHVMEKLDAGASLIQLYTGLIYEGPTLPSRICGALLSRDA